jgi:hypothetical protein
MIDVLLRKLEGIDDKAKLEFLPKFYQKMWMVCLELGGLKKTQAMFELDMMILEEMDNLSKTIKSLQRREQDEI